jgi:hypothetical protein
MKKFFTLFCSLASFSLYAQQSFTITSNTYLQNFDGMATTAAAALPANWKAAKDAGTPRTVTATYTGGVNNTEQIGGNNMSTSATNGIYNFGAGVAASASDRAIGGLSSGSASKNVNLMFYLSNDEVSTAINSLTISYDVEKYRNGSNTAGFAIQMYYSTDGITWVTAGSNFKTAFAADADLTGYASAPGTTTPVTSQELTVNVPAATGIYLLWNYAVASGTTTSNAQALSVDNISITANFGTVTPLKLTSFNAAVISNNISLNWTTTNEVNVKGFTVEKSKDGINFSEQSFVTAKNSMTANNYTATDVLGNGTTYYRLKMIDKDGSFTYSKVINLSSKAIKGLSVYPNPAVNGIAAVTHAAAGSHASIEVVDISGKRLAVQTVQAGAVQTSIDMGQLTKGNYFIIYTDGETRQSVQVSKK